MSNFATPRGPQIKFTKMHQDAEMPNRAHGTDAGADLHSVEYHEIHPSEQNLVGTGIGVVIPPGYAGLVTPRSGLAAKHGITITNSPGVIDSEYRGEIKVILRNTGPIPFTVNPGDRIAQLLIVPVELSSFVEVETLDDTDRGDGGFGSSGV